MKYWSADFVEERNVYEAQFRSVIDTPALHGTVLDSKDNIISTYELEVIKDACALKTRVDSRTFETVTDMCIMMEFRNTSHTDSEGNTVDGTSTTEFPVPLTELSEKLTDILLEHGVIK